MTPLRSEATPGRPSDTPASQSMNGSPRRATTIQAMRNILAPELPWEPESAESAKARFPLALTLVYTPAVQTEVRQGHRKHPRRRRENVFDLAETGIRMVATLDFVANVTDKIRVAGLSDPDGLYVHLEFTFQPNLGTVDRRSMKLLENGLEHASTIAGFYGIATALKQHQSLSGAVLSLLYAAGNLVARPVAVADKEAA